MKKNKVCFMILLMVCSPILGPIAQAHTCYLSKNCTHALQGPGATCEPNAWLLGFDGDCEGYQRPGYTHTYCGGTITGNGGCSCKPDTTTIVTYCYHAVEDLAFVPVVACSASCLAAIGAAIALCVLPEGATTAAGLAALTLLAASTACGTSCQWCSLHDCKLSTTGHAITGPTFDGVNGSGHCYH